MTGRALIAVAGLLTAAMYAGQPARAQVPSGATWTEVAIPSAGAVLRGDLFRPAGVAGRVPVIVYVSPYLNTGDYPTNPLGYAEPRFNPTELLGVGVFSRGYAVLEVSLRGYGESEGCADLGGRGEQADAKAAVEWAASQPWSTGRVGMWGMSYDGWTQVMAMAGHAKGLAAVVAQSPVVHPDTAMAMHGVRYLHAFGYAAGALYDEIDAQPGGPDSLRGGPGYFLPNATEAPAHPTCYADNQIGTLGATTRTPWVEERDLLPRAAGSRVPTLLSFGFQDDQVRPTQFLELWSSLRGPRHAWLGQWFHTPASAGSVPQTRDLIGRSDFLDQAMRWMDRYVKGLPESAAPVGQDPVVTVETGDGTWRAESAWPPRDATAQRLPLRSGSYLDAPGNSAELTGGQPVPGQAVTTPVLRAGVGAWTVTAPTRRAVHLAGVPQLRLRTTAPLGVTSPHLVALVYDIDAQGSARLVTRGAAVADRGRAQSVDLWPTDWRLAAGHRLGVLVTGADDSTFTPGTSGATVTFDQASLELPCLSKDHPATLSGTPSQAARAHAPFTVAADALAAAVDRQPCG